MPVSSTKRAGRILRRRGRESSKSLQKALRILFHVGSDAPEVGVTEVASALSLNKTTVHRLLNAMERFELIEKNPDTDRYRLGLKLHELGTRAVESRTLQGEARRFLLEIAAQSRESISLAVPTAAGVVCLDRVDSARSMISVRTAAGARFPAHCTAAGKAVLAYLPDEQVNSILAKDGMPRFTTFTITRVSELKENLRRTRQRGYALDSQELERGLTGIAVPVLTSSGTLVAAVGMAGPTPRFQGKELGQKVELLKQTADKISASIGSWQRQSRRGSAVDRSCR